MEQKEWSKRLVSLIAESVKHHRTARTPKLSTQKVADRCKTLGFPNLTRSVITSIEMGTRDSISVPEWLVLAEALEVAPLLLLFPLGRVEEIEVLPGRTEYPWDALVWAEHGHPDASKVMGDVVTLFRGHQQYVNQWLDTAEKLRSARAEADGTANWEIVTRVTDDGGLIGETPDPEKARIEAQRQEDFLAYYKDRLKIMRMRIERLGLQPPSLPEELLTEEEPKR